MGKRFVVVFIRLKAALSLRFHIGTLIWFKKKAVPNHGTALLHKRKNTYLISLYVNVVSLLVTLSR